MKLFDPADRKLVKVDELTAEAGTQFIVPESVETYEKYIQEGYAPLNALALVWMQTLVSDGQDGPKLFYLYNFSKERMNVFTAKKVGMLKIEYVPDLCGTNGVDLLPKAAHKRYIEYMIQGCPESYAIFHALIEKGK